MPTATAQEELAEILTRFPKLRTRLPSIHSQSQLAQVAKELYPDESFFPTTALWQALEAEGKDAHAHPLQEEQKGEEKKQEKEKEKHTGGHGSVSHASTSASQEKKSSATPSQDQQNSASQAENTIAANTSQEETTLTPAFTPEDATDTANGSVHDWLRSQRTTPPSDQTVPEPSPIQTEQQIQVNEESVPAVSEKALTSLPPLTQEQEAATYYVQAHFTSRKDNKDTDYEEEAYKEHLHDDPRFQNILRQVEGEYTKSHPASETPENKTSSLLITNKQALLNPTEKEKVLQEAEKRYNRVLPQAKKKFFEQERWKIHVKAAMDPFYRAARRKAQQKAEALHAAQVKNGTKQSPSRATSLLQAATAAYLTDFTLRFPQKAQAYAKEQTADGSLLTQILHTLQTVKAAGTLSHPPGSHSAPTDKPTPPFKFQRAQLVEKVKNRVRYPQEIGKETWEEEEIQYEPEEETEESYLVQEEQPSAPPDEAPVPITSNRAPLQKIIRRPSLNNYRDRPGRRMPGRNLTRQFTSRGLNMAKTAAKDAVKKYAKEAVKKAARAAAEKAAQAVASNPYVLAAIGIILLVLLLIIIIVIIVSGGGGGGSDTSTQTNLPLTFTKTGPAAIGNGDTIVYTLNASYPGQADDIVVTDQLPDNVDLVADDPRLTKPYTYDSATRTISWSVKKIQPNGSGTGTSTSGTIQNLGFGPSDGTRIDNLIKKLAPTSPLIGHGAEAVQLAKEYNVDPLMIIVMKNESQFCTDTGVVSPAGSDPDNYDCGGILWDTVTGTPQIDTARWQVAPGPTANGHVFAFVPTPSDGIGLFYNYIGVSSLYTGKTLGEFYDIYNPCSDPGNGGKFSCGQAEADNMLQLLKDNAGPASTGSDAYVGNGSSGGSSLAPQTITLPVRPKNPDIYVLNKATAQVIGAQTSGSGSGNGSGSGTGQGSAETCNGVYTKDIQSNPLKINFGDPDCTLDQVAERDNLYTLLKQQDPDNAYLWYAIIIPCESGYDPNDYASHEAIGTPDLGGAWGLFQMGQGLNGQYDHGDVPWKQQLTNAITYNKTVINGSFRYWECAKSFWK